MNQQRKEKPLASEEFVVHLPLIEKIQLGNGLKLLFIKKPELPIVRFTLMVNAGSRLDPEGLKGLSHMTGMTIDEGAGGLTSTELSTNLDNLGTRFSISTSKDHLLFSLQTLKENLIKSLELFSSIIINPHFHVEDFERERRKLLVRHLQMKDNTDELAERVFEANIFNNQSAYAYPVNGYEQNLSDITINAVKDFYNNFIRPGNSTIAVSGAVERDEITGLFKNYFDSWNDNPVIEPVEDKVGKGIVQIYIVNKYESVQSEIRIGHSSLLRNEYDYFSRTLLNSILGGQFSSRINLNLRENKGFTYGAVSSFNYFSNAAYFDVSTSVGTENTGSAINEIIYELKSIRNGVSPEELGFAKSALMRKFPLNFETLRQIVSNLTGMAIHSLPDNYFNSYVDNIKRVGLQDVNKAAEDIIHPEDLIIVIAGDKNKILPQIRNLEDYEIKETDTDGNIIA